MMFTHRCSTQPISSLHRPVACSLETPASARKRWMSRLRWPGCKVALSYIQPRAWWTPGKARRSPWCTRNRRPTFWSYIPALRNSMRLPVGDKIYFMADYINPLIPRLSVLRVESNSALLQSNLLEDDSLILRHFTLELTLDSQDASFGCNSNFYKNNPRNPIFTA